MNKLEVNITQCIVLLTIGECPRVFCHECRERKGKGKRKKKEETANCYVSMLQYSGQGQTPDQKAARPLSYAVCGARKIRRSFVAEI